MATFTETTEYVIETCCTCHVSFAMTRGLYDAKRSWRYDDGVAYGSERYNKAQFYCPNGHPQHYCGKSDEQRARELEEEVNRQRGLRRMAEEEASKARTVAKRETTRRRNIEKRVHAGICPKCKRRFANLADHMASKHGTREDAARVAAEHREHA